MPRYPLALLPSVTVSQGQAPLPPPGYGASEGSGTFPEVLARWADQGAGWVHVVDADAVAGSGSNLGLIVAAPVHVQYSGAVRDEPSLLAALATGASRVVIEADDPQWAGAAAKANGPRIAVALDIRHPDVLTLAESLQTAGCQRFVVSDRAESHHWRHGDRHLLAEFCDAVRVPVMARGGIAHLQDLHDLHVLVSHGLDGIILDEALYNGSFSYAEAMAAGADRFDMFVWGPPSQ
jgi:phosphoribosylformimino-5-aminoimidazole carboxamide ribonucleotide (ProFAR) isomerase